MAENINGFDLNVTVFIINKELPSNQDANVTDYDLWEAINVALGTEDRVRCIQRDGEIWRVELESVEDCKKLKEEGIKVEEPFPKGVKIRTTENVEKVLICGLPYSFEKDEINVMLNHLGVSLLTEVNTEAICVPDTENNSLVPNGNRYVLISPLNEDKCLPRNATCAGFMCRLYHAGQETRTSEVKCYDKVCRVCLEPDHDPTSPNCWYNTNQSKDVITFSKAGNKNTKTFPRSIIQRTRFKEKIVILNEDTNPLSMSFRCQFIFEGNQYNSVIEAYQTKRSGGIQSNSSLETSLGFEVNSLEIKGWTEQKERVIKDILLAKVNGAEEMLEKLKSIITTTAVFAEATGDYYWGTGLSREETEQTHPSQWPGKNRLGRIVKETVSEMINIPKITFYTLNANGLRDSKKRNHLFTWLERQKFDIILLQETHFDDDIIRSLTGNYTFYHCKAVEKNPKTQNKKKRKRKVFVAGVSVLVRKSLPNMNSTQQILQENDGRTLVLQLTYEDKTFVLVNVYAKSGNHCVEERKKHFKSIFDFIKNNYTDEDSNRTIILGGDFNCKLDSQYSEASQRLLKASLSELELFDSWKHFRKYVSGFTCTAGTNPSRIDYIFLHKNLNSSILDMNLRSPPSLHEKKHFSDHKGIYLKIEIRDLMHFL